MMDVPQQTSHDTLRNANQVYHGFTCGNITTVDSDGVAVPCFHDGIIDGWRYRSKVLTRVADILYGGMGEDKLEKQKVLKPHTR
jgi:hypothetical protein